MCSVASRRTARGTAPQEHVKIRTSHPKQAPMPKMMKKRASGVKFLAPMLWSSLIAYIKNISSALAMNSEKNCPVVLMKSAG